MSDISFFNITPHSFQRNTGYKDTAYALSEIVDNAAEEDARNITILVKEQRSPRKIISVGILDDGGGMTPEILQKAVCLNNGTRFLGTSRSSKKFGKYGVGLPNGSISQAKRFTVWSWQNGSPEEAHKNGIDIEDIEWINSGAKIPVSPADPVPQDWFDLSGHEVSPSGTFVLWENCDRLTWVTARGLIRNLEFLLGRIYRKLLPSADRDEESEKINLRVVVFDERMQNSTDYPIRPNDPLYITPNTGVPEPDMLPDWEPGTPLFDKTVDSAFEVDCFEENEDGELVQKTVEIKVRASESTLKARSIIDGRNPGGQPWGKHCSRNQGVSILREAREIILTPSWCQGYDPRERWWGLELDFPSELDDFLGVTNNKQSADKLLNVAHISEEDVKEEGETTTETLERIEREDPNRAFLLGLCWQIDAAVRDLRRNVLAQNSPRINLRNPDEIGEELDPEVEPSSEDEATDIADDVDEAQEDPDGEPPLPPEQREEAMRQGLRENNVPEEEITNILNRVITSGSKYIIQKKPGLGRAFFSVQRIVDAKLITINTDHPAFLNLVDALEGAETTDLDHALETMRKAKISLMLLLEAWAKLETEARGNEAQFLSDAREDWGKHLRDFANEHNQRLG
ncbi:MAG: ATP-binding protein [Opitutales bacterium]